MAPEPSSHQPSGQAARAVPRPRCMAESQRQRDQERAVGVAVGRWQGRTQRFRLPMSVAGNGALPWPSGMDLLRDRDRLGIR